MADEFEGVKPTDMGPLATKVLQKLASLYPKWKQFPPRCVIKGNPHFDQISKFLHNKFDNSYDLVKRTVARLRRQRVTIEKRASVDVDAAGKRHI